MERRREAAAAFYRKVAEAAAEYRYAREGD
jgi:hypothetical protein